MTTTFDARAWARPSIRLLAAALAALLVGCGGGAPDAGPQALPAAVTAAIPAAGGSMDVDLADGASATLVFAANAFATAQSVTVTPLAAEGGDWTRFSIQPGMAELRAPLILRVRPPAGVSASDVPVLQVIAADAPVLLRTTVLADGRLEATLQPDPEPAAASAATAGRARAQAAGRPLADGDAEATRVAGAGFLAVCKVPQPAIDNARRVILNASRALQVNTALGTLAMLHERCSTPEALGALDAFVTQIPGLYADALSAWKAVNYIEVEAQAETFRRGVRRVLALCAAARELGATLDCPLAADLDPEYTEIANGFSAAANERESQGNLRLLFDQVAALPAEAELFALPQAAPALRDTVAVIADLLMDRAYVLCNGGELFEWADYIEQAGPSRRSVQTVRKAIAYCGLNLTAKSLRSTESGMATVGEVQFAPGSLDGVGRTTKHSFELPFDAFVGFAPVGSSVHCSRVVGTPEGTESLILRVGDHPLEVFRPVFVGSSFGPGREATLGIAAILADIGRAADSTDPIRIDVYRGAVNVAGCSDSRGNPLTISLPETLLYSLTLEPPHTIDVSLDIPSPVSGPTTFTLTARDLRAGTPAAGAAVRFTVLGDAGSVSSSSATTDAAGRLVATLIPVPGPGSIVLVADVLTAEGAPGQAVVTIELSALARVAGTYEGTVRIVGHAEPEPDDARVTQSRNLTEIAVEGLALFPSDLPLGFALGSNGKLRFLGFPGNTPPGEDGFPSSWIDTSKGGTFGFRLQGSLIDTTLTLKLFALDPGKEDVLQAHWTLTWQRF